MGKENIKVDVSLIIRKSCHACKEVLSVLATYMNRQSHINFTIIDLDEENSFKWQHSTITPSVWINDKMWYAGKVNIERFDEKIKKLINL